MSSAAYSWRLAAWVLVGLGGIAVFMVGGLTDDPLTFALGVIPAWLSIFMLGSGLWMRWPRGR